MPWTNRSVLHASWTAMLFVDVAEDLAATLLFALHSRPGYAGEEAGFLFFVGLLGLNVLLSLIQVGGQFVVLLLED